MSAASGTFYIFVAVVFLLYWLCAGARLPRLSVILLANYFFCAQFGLFYVVLIPACSIADYLVGAGLTRFRNSLARRLLLSASIALNLGLLIGSRHMPWFLNPHPGPARWDWVFPLGLSFYAFQALTYTFDIYRRDAEASPSLLAHLSAVSFFPTMQAGPIVRVTELVRQFGARAVLSRTDGGRAFFLIGMGLLKKMLIADYLAFNLVNRVFDTPKLYSGAESLIAVYAYSLQLYYDFSGYTDIARGTAMLLGIKLPVNFDQPYLAVNITDFWRRWHISFSNWLRDYLYFSLPGVRTRVMPYLNLVITMVLGGLWHGFAWTFAIWGLMHGVALAAARLWQSWRGRRRQPAPFWSRALGIFCTYHFVCLTWVFFRAASVADAMVLLSRMASLTVGLENISATLAGVMLLAAGAHFVGREHYQRVIDTFAEWPFLAHAAALLLVAVALQLLAGRADTPFVYSRF